MSDQPELEFTGERFTPECVREIRYEHLHRYAWAQRLVAGLDVLDAACGEGYGSSILAGSASSVLGADLDQQSIDHARRRYRAPNLGYRQADCTALPLAENSFDAVVSFETLEHLEAQQALMTEFRRVLKPGGFLLLSSPDRKTYSDQTGFDNPHHVRELYREELEALLKAHFSHFRLFGQKLMFNSAIWSLTEGAPATGPEAICESDQLLESSRLPALEPLYFLVIAGDDPSHWPAVSELSLFCDREESVYAHYNEEVRRHIQAGRMLIEQAKEIEALKQRIAELEGTPGAGGESER